MSLYQRLGDSCYLYLYFGGCVRWSPKASAEPDSGRYLVSAFKLVVENLSLPTEVNRCSLDDDPGAQAEQGSRLGREAVRCGSFLESEESDSVPIRPDLF